MIDYQMEGKLHLSQSIDVINCPHIKYELNRVVNKYEKYDKEKLIKCEFYEVTKYNIHNEVKLVQDKTFQIINVTD